MADKSEWNDPWAPPESGPPRDRAEPGPRPSPGVHEQPTVTSMPTGGFGTVDPGGAPLPPAAPGGPAQPAPGPYGYPAPAPAPPAAYGYPAPAPVPPPAYGYPGHPGAPGYGGYGPGGWQQPPANGMGVAAMVLGIISVAGFCLYGLGIVLGVLALVFGIIGRKRVRRGEADNGGMATAGIVLGVIGTLISAVFIALMVWSVVEFEEGGETYENDKAPYAAVLSLTGSR